jgi:hypothetical protein
MHSVHTCLTNTAELLCYNAGAAIHGRKIAGSRHHHREAASEERSPQDADTKGAHCVLEESLKIAWQLRRMQ